VARAIRSRHRMITGLKGWDRADLESLRTVELTVFLETAELRCTGRSSQ